MLIGNSGWVRSGQGAGARCRSAGRVGCPRQAEAAPRAWRLLSLVRRPAAHRLDLDYQQITHLEADYAQDPGERRDSEHYPSFG